MSDAQSEILSELGWDEGISMPVANYENKQLEDNLNNKQSLIVRYKAELEEHDDRVTAISDHLKNVLQELQNSQKLSRARKSEISTEAHLVAIADREKGRLKSEIRRIQDDLANKKDVKNNLENLIFRKTQVLEELKSQMNWDQKALDEWLKEASEKDEDYMTLQKYTRQDESKVKEITLKIENITNAMGKKQRLLENEVTETLTCQLALDKTAEEFRKAHFERQELIRQWEQTIDLMKKRDKEINDLSIQLAQVKNIVHDHSHLLQEKEKFCDVELMNNAEKQKLIGLRERELAKHRSDLKSIEKQKVAFQDELESLKNSVEKCSSDLDQARSYVNSLKKQIEIIYSKIKSASEVRKSLQEKLKITTETEMSAEEKASIVDRILQKEEEKIQCIARKVEQLHDLHFKKAQELFDAINREKSILAEISGAKTAAKNLQSAINKLDADGLKQQELIYSQDFSIQTLERKLWKMQGEVKSNDEQLQLDAKVQELNNYLDSITQRYSLLSLQLKRLNEDSRKVKRDLDVSGNDQQKLMVKIDELELHNSISLKELTRKNKFKQDMMVTENMIKLDVKRLRDMLGSKSDEVINLERHKAWLLTSMKERREEIQIHQNMLRSQIKISNEERQTVSAELHERISKIDKLRKRYEIIMISMQPADGEEDKSAAFYVIKAAQEKEALQRQGDELDAKIRKGEKEMRALENTLRLMNGRNETYRKSLNKVSETSETLEDQENMLIGERAAMDKLKYKRRQLNEIQEDFHSMLRTMQALTVDTKNCDLKCTDYSQKVQQLKHEIDEQHEKISRSQRQVSKQTRELRSARQAKGSTLEERDFDLREIRDFNRKVLTEIANLIRNNDAIRQPMSLFFNQAGLDLPNMAPPSADSSRSSSRASSARSENSSARASSARKFVSPKPVEFSGAVLGQRPSTVSTGSRPQSTRRSAKSSIHK